MRRLRDRGGPAGVRYTMREKMFAIGDDFWIETEGGDRAFKVNGKALRIRDTLVLESPGEELLTIQEKKLSVRDRMEIERGGRRWRPSRRRSSASATATRSTSRAGTAGRSALPPGSAAAAAAEAQVVAAVGELLVPRHAAEARDRFDRRPVVVVVLPAGLSRASAMSCR